MDYLRRNSAPLAETVWKALDEAVAQTARHVMAARRVASFDGPKGWEHAAVRLGTMRPCPTTAGKASVCVPDVVLLTEIRVDFTLPWTLIDVYERGAPALDTRAAEDAAREVALAEDMLGFYGEPIGAGFLTSPESPRVKTGDWSRSGVVVTDIVAAIETLDAAGVAGPYEAVLAPGPYYAYHRAVAEGGYPVSRHLHPLLAAVHRSMVIRETGAVFATRGGDFILTVGGDLSVGYRQHDRDAVQLMCVETIAAQTQSADAACLLTR